MPSNASYSASLHALVVLLSDPFLRPLPAAGGFLRPLAATCLVFILHPQRPNRKAPALPVCVWRPRPDSNGDNER